MGGSIVATLLELDPVGRWTRLEIASSAGLLTLHPDPAGASVHGNTVTPDGMRHHAIPWTPEHRLILPGSIVGLATLAASLTGTVGVGETSDVAGLAVDPWLHVDEVAIEAARPAADRWRLAIAGEVPDEIRLDGRGWPIVAGAAEWPLEIEPEMRGSVDAVWTTAPDGTGISETRG